MLPMIAVRQALGTLLAADAALLAPAMNPNKIALIIAAFVPNENLALASLTLASSNGLSPLAGIAGTQGTALDPVSQAQIITMLPPTTGWRWVTSGSFASPITVFGYALTDNAGAVLLAVEQLPVPITVQAAGYQVELDPIQMTFVLQPIN
jgi:hypothetical protein